MASNAPQLTPASPTAGRLDDLFTKQKQAFAEQSMAPLGTRREHLQRLIEGLRCYRDEFIDAISSDFGHRAAAETLSAEILTSLEGLRYARRNLRAWMRPRRARTGLLMFSTSAATRCQPKGVVGIIAPWNYPLLLVMGPLTYALAAGNRVMIKPSEFTPATSRLIARMIAERFDEDHVAVVTGESEVGIAFSQLPFDHLLFTGSTGVGRHVMRAAAEHLTPVTLELGGKSPTIIGPQVDLEMAAERICFGKSLNAGQTCTAPDYVLCPRGRRDEFIAALRAAHARMYPSLAHNDDYTTIVNDRHYERLHTLLHDARTKEAQVIEFNPANETFDPASRKMPLHVLVDVDDDMDVMQEEIFGPLLPIVDCESVDEAIAFINDRPRPLALNVFDDDEQRIAQVVERTHSGGLCINDTVMHVAIDDLPFGGSGASGMGRYQGREGFDTFSNLRGVYRRPRRLNTARVLYPPYGGRMQRWLQRFFIGS